MDAVISIIEFALKNLKKPRFWITVIILLIIVVMLFPYLDANIFYYNRMDKRVEILAKLSEIDIDTISDNSILIEEYNLILKEIEDQREKNINYIVSTDYFSNINNKQTLISKFISGGILIWILMLCVPFMNTFKKGSDKLLAFILLGVFGALLGGIAILIPTIINPWVNYIGFNLLIIILTCVAVSSANKKKAS